MKKIGLIASHIASIILTAFVTLVFAAIVMLPEKKDNMLRWIEISETDLQNAQVQHQVAMLYWAGCYIPKDREKALEYLRMSADQGYPLAMFHMGNTLLMSKNREQNIEEAMRWFQKAAEAGHAKANLRLGNIYFMGKLTDTDYQLAYRYLKRATELGCDPTSTHLSEVESKLAPAELESVESELNSEE